MGSNLGDRRANLQAAIQSLAPPVQVRRVSPVYITPPWGITDQPDFLNLALHGVTNLTPQAVLGHLKSIETRLGRTPTLRNGPRLIDIDILFYDDCILNSENLAIPHPRLAERAFVLVPLADLAPELRHPITGRSVREMLRTVARQGVVLSAKDLWNEVYEKEIDP
jgi:2-amino-4-hydroxy-6-hydroxymethyldihydropteridine diphosphokinase